MVQPSVDALAALLAFGQMLKQQSARDPMSVMLCDRQADQARDLLRLREKALRCLRQAVALQRDDPLVALVHHRMIEGDREIALAEQRE